MYHSSFSAQIATSCIVVLKFKLKQIFKVFLTVNLKQSLVFRFFFALEVLALNTVSSDHFFPFPSEINCLAV